jgi:hypothetical protein
MKRKKPVVGGKWGRWEELMVICYSLLGEEANIEHRREEECWILNSK